MTQDLLNITHTYWREATHGSIVAGPDRSKAGRLTMNCMSVCQRTKEAEGC